MEAGLSFLGGLGIETLSGIALTILGFLFKGWKKIMETKLHQVCGLLDELTSALEDDKISAEEAKKISVKARALFTGKVVE